MMVSKLLELLSSLESVRKVPAVEVEVDAVAEAAVVVPLDKTVKVVMARREKRKRPADPRLATNVDKKVTSLENALTPLLRVPDVEVNLDVPMEVEPRDTVLQET